MERSKGGIKPFNRNCLFSASVARSAVYEAVHRHPSYELNQHFNPDNQQHYRYDNIENVFRYALGETYADLAADDCRDTAAARGHKQSGCKHSECQHSAETQKGADDHNPLNCGYILMSLEFLR